MKEIKGIAFFALTTAVNVVNAAGDSDMTDTDTNTNIDSQPGNDNNIQSLLILTAFGLSMALVGGIFARVVLPRLQCCLPSSSPCCRGGEDDDEVGEYNNLPFDVDADSSQRRLG